MQLAACQLIGLLFASWTPEEILQPPEKSAEIDFIKVDSMNKVLFCIAYAKLAKSDFFFPIGYKFLLIYLTRMFYNFKRFLHIRESNREKFHRYFFHKKFFFMILKLKPIAVLTHVSWFFSWRI